MPRSRAIFEKVCGVAERSLGCSFALDYHAASDEGVFEPEVLAARARREQASTASFLEATRKLHTLADFHAWLFQTHLCYAVARQGEFGVQAADDVDAKALASY
ncbi:hypothetical protein WJX81_006513 [Elliptochloris bilobata]|uniref:Uncharacterized protein n=1 Tax=Elliptochloris bilobata TaxID=381761 RepID=A0AAW1SLG1_9CHLO